MRLILDNLIYTTEDPVYIERLESLGAVKMDMEVKEDDIEEKEDYSKFNVEDLKSLLKERGIEFEVKAKKDDLIKLLEV